jgi:hypothetical protein
MAYSNSQDAEMAIIQFEKDLQKAVADEGIFESQINALNREKLELMIKLADLKEPLRKAKENIRRTDSELRCTRSEFFSLKRQNL